MNSKGFLTLFRVPHLSTTMHPDIIFWYKHVWLGRYTPPYLTPANLNLFYSLILLSIGAIRPFRTLIGLPANGQRTWSNGRGAKITPSVLYSAKYALFKRIIRPKMLGRSIFLAEYINLFWYNQFFWEWVSNQPLLSRLPIYVRRYSFIDIYNINRLYIYTSYHNSFKEGKKKHHRKKKNPPKNKFASGFQFGFSKKYNVMLQKAR